MYMLPYENFHLPLKETMTQHLSFAILLQLADQYREIMDEYSLRLYPSNLTPETLSNAQHNMMYVHASNNEDAVDAIEDIIKTYAKYLGKMNEY